MPNNGFASSAFRSNRNGPGVYFRQHLNSNNHSNNINNNNNYNNKQNTQQHYNNNSKFLVFLSIIWMIKYEFLHIYFFWLYIYSGGGTKDVPPRFKKSMMLGTQLGAPGIIEDVSLRPAAFKPPKPRPVNLMPAGNNQ